MIRHSLFKIVFIWILLMAAAALLGDVSVAASDVGRTAADFLLIGQGARAASLGGAYTAISSGAVSSYWNPAGLTTLEGTEVSLGHFSWLQDITVEQAAFGFPVSDRLAGGLSFTYVNYGTIEGYDISGVSTGELTAYDYSAGLSLGFNLLESVSVGVTGKYVAQRLDKVSASATAFDFGVRYDGGSFVLAGSIVNLGSRMKFDQTEEKLPTAARLGVSVIPFMSGLTTSLELEQRFEGDLVIRQGVELGFSEMYYLRTGYDYLPAQQDRWLATRISVGAGIRLDVADLDYSFTPNDKSTTEDLHRFTVTFHLSH